MGKTQIHAAQNIHTHLQLKYIVEYKLSINHLLQFQPNTMCSFVHSSTAI